MWQTHVGRSMGIHALPLGLFSGRLHQVLCLLILSTPHGKKLSLVQGFKVVENRMQQCCAAHIVHSCQQYCSALLSLNQPAIRYNNAEQYC